jgi:hypothetical protein
MLPHGKPDCVTHLRKDETINEAITRITMPEGRYKMYWMLSQKAQQKADLGPDLQKMLKMKA